MIGLNCADLVSDLDFIFSTDMLNLNKSQNEFFERVSQIIGVPKEDCVMFEDSLYAMQGARNAGLGVIGMTDATNTRDREAIPRLLRQGDRFIRRTALIKSIA